jgi:hypothetical protein
VTSYEFTIFLFIVCFGGFWNGVKDWLDWLYPLFTGRGDERRGEKMWVGAIKIAVGGAEMTSARTLGVGKNYHSDQVKPHTNDK